MKKLLDLIKSKIKNTKNEYYNNFIFCIKHKDENIKREIKECLIQGDDKLNHTIIEIDFVKEKQKSSKKERLKRKTENLLNKNKSSAIITCKQSESVDKIKDLSNKESKEINDLSNKESNDLLNDLSNKESNDLLESNEINNLSNDDLLNDLLNKQISEMKDLSNNLKNNTAVCNESADLEFKNQNILDNIPDIKIYNNPIYICGRYIKLNRIMSQTPLIINNVSKTTHSISDFSEEFKKFYLADTVKFMASGREDIDVKCIEGRPFILEIISPKRNLHATSMNIELYDTINIIDTFITTKDCKKLINEDVSDKHYLLAVHSDKPIVLEKIYKLKQKTPLRVLHRRANDIRFKTITIIEYNEFFFDKAYYYEIFIKASSGTYIKEWVNGDFGRTIPNLNSDLLELDVHSVEKKFTDDIKKQKFILIKKYKSVIKK